MTQTYTTIPYKLNGKLTREEQTFHSSFPSPLMANAVLQTSTIYSSRSLLPGTRCLTCTSTTIQTHLLCKSDKRKAQCVMSPSQWRMTAAFSLGINPFQGHVCFAPWQRMRQKERRKVRREREETRKRIVSKEG